MRGYYTVDLSLDDCLARLNNQQKAIQLDNGYSLSTTVQPTPIGTGAYRVQVTRPVDALRCADLFRLF